MERNLKVLIGDNSMNFGVSCREMLNKNGSEVMLTGKDGIKVLEGIKSFCPDVVVIESFMAELDAVGVMKELKKLEARPKIIVVSGYDNSFIETEVMKNGASYYILRPFEISDLCERIMSVGGAFAVFKGNEQPEEDLETVVTEVILNVGIPAHIKGYHYIREAIIMCIEDGTAINYVTKLLYPTIAHKFETTASRVERAIRHGIEIAWDRGDVDTLNSYFGYTINNGRGKPTNSEFIAMISDKLRLKLKRLKKAR